MTTTNKRGLGRGLSSLLGDINLGNDSEEKTLRTDTSSLPIFNLRPGRFQPRRHFDTEPLTELTESIRKNGVIQPIIVRLLENDTHEIIAGERRWRAAKEAGLEQVPVVIRNFDDKQALAVALLENIQRENLSPVEEAEGYQRLMDEFSYTQEALAGELGKSRSHIANLLRILTLPESVKSSISEGKLSMGHARALVGNESASEIAKEIIAKNLSVRAAEKFAKGWGSRKKENETGAGNVAGLAPKQKSPYPDTQFATIAEPTPEKDEDIILLEQNLSDNLGVRVEIDGYDPEGGGRVSLHFDTLGELDHILQFLQRSSEEASEEKREPSVRVV